MAKDTSDIYLRSNQDFFGLLNTHLSVFTYDDKEYRTAEHLFQALKFTDTESAEAIRKSDNPLTHAYQLEAPPEVKAQRRADWYTINKVMLKIALYHKFTQHDGLKDLLLSTKSRKLINNVADRYWGIGQDRKGEDQFGVALMEVRNELRDNKSPEVPQLPIDPKPIYLPTSPNDPGYYCLTNVAPFSVFHSGTEWKSSEHLIHAWKFPLDTVILASIYDAKPEDVCFLSQHTSGGRIDWDMIKFDVMTYVVHLKFTCQKALDPSLYGRSLQQILTDTEGTELIWNPNDRLTWHQAGEGRNEFGKALMRVRDIILYKLEPPSQPPGPPQYISNW